jgi:hypothetical protein
MLHTEPQTEPDEERRPPGPTITKCAWCNMFSRKPGMWIAEDTTGHPPGTRYSHGICPTHQAEWKREAGL